MTNRMMRELHYYFLCLYEAFDDNSVLGVTVADAKIDAFCSALIMTKTLPINEAWVYMDESTSVHLTILDRD